MGNRRVVFVPSVSTVTSGRSCAVYVPRVINDLHARNVVGVLDQRSMAKRGRARGGDEWLVRAALDHFSLCDGPTIESRAISQLSEAGPKSDDTYHPSECADKDSFHKDFAREN
jgi:hypothetical protein